MCGSVGGISHWYRSEVALHDRTHPAMSVVGLLETAQTIALVCMANGKLVLSSSSEAPDRITFAIIVPSTGPPV